MDTKDFEEIYNDTEPNELGSIQGNAKAIKDLIEPIVDSPDKTPCGQELDILYTFCIEAENNANYEDNWSSRIEELDNAVEAVKESFADIGLKIEELITVLMEPLWDMTAEDRQQI